MERILVSMDTRNGAWEAWRRAIMLAKRIDARVYALLVLPPDGNQAGHSGEKSESAIRTRLELLIELAQTEGVRVDYFISEGSYEDELIRFIDNNKITLLVVEVPDGESRIRKILHRIACRVELVSPRKVTQTSE